MKPSFKGWYYKQQANGKTLAVIPGKSSDSAFILAITDTASYNITYNLSDYSEDRQGKDGILRIGDSSFSNSGIKLRINSDVLSLNGDLEYRNLTPIRGDIMGPFRFFPMECRHGIVSMKHSVHGRITLNNEEMDFYNGVGYIETDSGVSFPEGYAWVHCNDFKESCSIMAAVAKIPFMGFHFWGCICVVWIDGKEYRLATYKGAKILQCEHNIIKIKQGNYTLTVKANQQNAHNLAAPKFGVMSRIIKESPSCPAEFLFTKKGDTIFSDESLYASYEYMMNGFK